MKKTIKKETFVLIDEKFKKDINVLEHKIRANKYAINAMAKEQRELKSLRHALYSLLRMLRRTL